MAKQVVMNSQDAIVTCHFPDLTFSTLRTGHPVAFLLALRCDYLDNDWRYSTTATLGSW
jgi:hypothetical protein